METKKNELATTSSSTVATANQNQAFKIELVDLNNTFPNLNEAVEYPFDLMADYWTPENKGENKRVAFDKIAERKVLDQQTTELIDLECAFFYELVNGEIRSVSNGSKRLVGAIEVNGIVRGTPLLITYMGKKKNKNNSYMSDNWSVKILDITKKA